MSTIITLRVDDATRQRLALSGDGSSLTRGAFVAIPDEEGAADFVTVQFSFSLSTALREAAVLRLRGVAAQGVRILNATLLDDVLLGESDGPESVIEIVDSCDYHRAPQLADALSCVPCGGHTGNDGVEALECPDCVANDVAVALAA